MKANLARRWLPAVGLITHLVFLALLLPLADYIEDRVWEQIADDPQYVWNSGDLFWDPEYDEAAVIACFPVGVYLPTGLSGLILYAIYRKRYELKPWPVLGTSLGIFTVLYVAFWLVRSSP